MAKKQIKDNELSEKDTKTFSTFAIRVDKDEPQEIIDWLTSQKNKSESIKFLIKKAINDYGIIDIREIVFLQNEKIFRENKIYSENKPVEQKKQISKVEAKTISDEKEKEMDTTLEKKEEKPEDIDDIVSDFIFDQ